MTRLTIPPAEVRAYLDPPAPFTGPVVLCPSCSHGIDPHGLNPGGPCGVGDDRGKPCGCMWSPNDIAAYDPDTDLIDDLTRALREQWDATSTWGYKVPDPIWESMARLAIERVRGAQA